MTDSELIASCLFLLVGTMAFDMVVMVTSPSLPCLCEEAEWPSSHPPSVQYYLSGILAVRQVIWPVLPVTHERMWCQYPGAPVLHGSHFQWPCSDLEKPGSLNPSYNPQDWNRMRNKPSPCEANDIWCLFLTFYDICLWFISDKIF
jgi:hypothetical protein